MTKEPLPRGQSGEGATTCSKVSWFSTTVQVFSDISTAPETAPSSRSATYMCKRKGPHAFLPREGALCGSDLQLAAPGSLQAKEKTFTGQAPVGSQGRAVGQEQVSEGSFGQEAASWILVRTGTQQQDYCIGANLTCCINGCPYSIKEIVPSS